MKYRNFLNLIFFGNYFYGCCAVVLSLEAFLVQKIQTPSIYYFLFIFLITVWYYTASYTREGSQDGLNERSLWYKKHHSFLKNPQFVFAILCVAMLFFAIVFCLKIGMRLSIEKIVKIFSFPILAGLYYGISSKLNFRNIGWLKPFLIGITWSGFVSLMPLFYTQIVNVENIEISRANWFLFIINMLFISSLSILFDIKDYAEDSNKKLKTFVVNNGLRKTIFYIVYPLSLLTLSAFLIDSFLQHQTVIQQLIKSISFLFLFLVSYSLQKRKPVLYYFIVVDGLMFLKGFCGILVALYFS